MMVFLPGGYVHEPDCITWVAAYETTLKGAIPAFSTVSGSKPIGHVAISQMVRWRLIAAASRSAAATEMMIPPPVHHLDRVRKVMGEIEMLLDQE